MCIYDLSFTISNTPLSQFLKTLQKENKLFDELVINHEKEMSLQNRCNHSKWNITPM